MNGQLGRHATEFLVACRYPTKLIAAADDNTRLLHDLGVLGDTAVEQFELLRDKFFVDLTAFPFAKYFPNEYSIDALMLSAFRRLPLGKNRLKKFSPLTLSMIDTAIKRKKWPFD